MDRSGPDRRPRARGVRRGPEDDARVGRDVRAAHGRGRRGLPAARPGLGRPRRHPGSVPRGSDLHHARRLVGRRPPGRPEPGSLPGHSRGGAGVGPPGQGARRRRNQVDARRHGLVPGAEASSGEGPARDRRGADRGGAGARPARHRACPEPRGRQGRGRGRSDGPRPRGARSDRRSDAGRDAEPSGLLRPDHGHFRVPGRCAHASSAG